MSTETFEDVECIHETTDAIKVILEGKERWIPKWAVHDDSEVYGKGHKGDLVVLSKFAEKELG